MQTNLLCRIALALCLLAMLPAAVAEVRAQQNEEFQALQSHFERVAAARFDTLFSRYRTVDQWETRRAQLRQCLERMLWHERDWPSGPPPAVVTRRVQARDYTLECLVLETAPGLHATANLYLPKTGSAPYPVVLYQCGHANKRIFKHHGAWFAARGIAVLIMDNIEMGEIEFTHHGVYAHAWFHWYSRGFSPLAVELLNARRCLDYLVSRPELDPRRIGATGVSGGGMATFFLAAVDQRVAASAPVSGSLSTPGWIRKGLSSAHCDCQYPVNSHGLLYSEVGALTAPRAQLLCNATADRGFPMDAFGEMFDKMGEVYRLYQAGSALDTALVPGGHGDNEVIRLPVYAFFLKQFLGKDTLITAQGPVETLPDAELVCWREGYPLDERLNRIDEELVPAFTLPAVPPAGRAREQRARELAGVLRREVFRYFPAESAPLEPVDQERSEFQGRQVGKVSFTSFPGLRVRGSWSLPAGAAKGKLPAVLVIDHRKGIPVWGNEQPLEGCRWGERAVLLVETIDRGGRALEGNLRSFSDDDSLHHLRRTAMVAGTTLESMRLYEVLRALEWLRSRPEVDPARITIVGRGEEGIQGLYAALLDGAVERAVLESPPASHRQGPCYLDILRYTDIPEVVALIGDRVRLYGEVPPGLRLYLEGSGPAGDLSRRSLAECLP